MKAQIDGASYPGAVILFPGSISDNAQDALPGMWVSENHLLVNYMPEHHVSQQKPSVGAGHSA